LKQVYTVMHGQKNIKLCIYTSNLLDPRTRVPLNKTRLVKRVKNFPEFLNLCFNTTFLTSRQSFFLWSKQEILHKVSYSTVISGYRREGREIYALPGYDAAYSGVSLVTFREKNSNISW